jgi:glycoprotein endo-alpha-1,2-mannosidase
MAPNAAATAAVAVCAAAGVFIGLMLDLKDGNDLVLGGFDGLYTYFASDAVSYASNPEHWQQIAE